MYSTVPANEWHLPSRVARALSLGIIFSERSKSVSIM
eukprot:Gb_38474 [translate_table: standard]